MDNLKKNYLLACISVTVFLVFTILTLIVDVQAIGPEGSSVGFAGVNGAFHNLTGYNEMWYLVSKYTGYLVFFIPVFFALLGVLQLISGKSLKKVDTDLFVLAGLYVVMMGMYVVFEKVEINYRPVIIDVEEGLEASFPSTHTMMTIVLVVSAIMQLRSRLKQKNTLFTVEVFLGTIMVVMVLSRLFSGVHWLTDIIGGILISTSLLLFYYAINYHIKYNKLCKTIREQYKA